MLKLVYELFCSVIQVATFFVFLNLLLKEYDKDVGNKKYLAFVILCIITVLVHSSIYAGIYTLIIFMLLTFVLFLIYKMDVSKSFLTAGIFMMTLIFSDMLTSIIFISFAEVDEIRGKYLILANVIVFLITNLIVSRKSIRSLFLNVINVAENKKGIEVVIFLVMLICALCIIMHIIGKNFYLDEIYTLSVVGMFLFVILALIFFKEKYEKNKVIAKYDQLFEYMNTFEEWIDNESLNVHETKNQYATLRELVKNNKKAVEYIDNIINENNKLEIKGSQKLRNIPKGGLKGLLCYKLTIAENNGINFFIDVSPNTKNALSKLNVENMKILCRIVGILLDNAIEEINNVKQKNLSCEIYLNNKRVNIVISNPYKNNIELDKLKLKGYSTKGNNRGNGLYFINKINKKNKLFCIEHRIINDYFIQKIIINE